MSEYCKNCIELTGLLEQLQAERDKVKELEQQNSKLRAKITEERAEFRKSAEYANCEKVTKYKQALDEIEEIAKLSNMFPTTTSMQYELIRILDIISKTEGEESD